MKKTLTTIDYRLKTRKTSGFTLVEVMVAVGLFVTVMLVGVGAVLNTNVTHKRTLAIRQVMDSVNFLVEDMARNIRLGSNYNCIIVPGVDFEVGSNGSVASNPSMDEPEHCTDGLSIAFKAQDGNQMAYIINSVDGNIQKISHFDGQSVLRDVTPAFGQGQAQLEIDPIQSGFTVIGPYPYPSGGALDPSDTDKIQPRVIIRLSGYIDYKQIRVPFAIQTTVTQRLIDS